MAQSKWWTIGGSLMVGTIAGFLVGMISANTGSYMSGFMVLGALVILGGVALLSYGRVVERWPEPSLGLAAE
jgi:hypothetical protein